MAPISETLMRKGTLLLAIVFAFSAATAASAAKKMKAAPPDPAVQAQKNSQAFFEDLFHPWASSAAMPQKPKHHKMKAKKKT